MLICLMEICKGVRSQWLTALRHNSENYLKNLQNCQNFGFNQYMMNFFSNLNLPNQSFLNSNLSSNVFTNGPLQTNGQIPFYMKPNSNNLNPWSNFNTQNLWSNN